MTNVGDEAYVVNGVILPVSEMSENEIATMEVAGFLRAEWDGHHWLYPTAKSLNAATGGNVFFANKAHDPSYFKPEEEQRG